jgi:hypothetical protein
VAYEWTLSTSFQAVIVDKAEPSPQSTVQLKLPALTKGKVKFCGDAVVVIVKIKPGEPEEEEDELDEEEEEEEDEELEEELEEEDSEELVSSSTNGEPVQLPTTV